jgi:hypothetical protein
VIRKPTVVAFRLPAADTLRGSLAEGLIADFRSYTALAAPRLDEMGLALVATTSDSIVVELAGGPRRVIMLGGLDFPFGYVLVEPGYPEAILTGVSTEDELLEQADWYFGSDEEEAPDSMPERVTWGSGGPEAGDGLRTSSRVGGLAALPSDDQPRTMNSDHRAASSRSIRSTTSVVTRSGMRCWPCLRVGTLADAI